jgi:hypothetical protein
MWRIGDQVRVAVNSSESRKGLIACVNESPRSYDILLFDSYGNSDQSDTIGSDELERVDSVRIKPLFPWEFTPRLSLEDQHVVPSLRAAGSDMFRVCDWRGAVSIYKQLLSILENSEFFLFKVSNHIRLGRTVSDTVFADHGEIDPISDTLPQWRRETSNVEMNVSKFIISLDPRIQTSSLLNLGRALANMGEFDDAIATISYAIFVACVVPEEGKVLKTKSFFWRGKIRLSVGRGSAALRDAESAHTLATQVGDVSLINECRVLINAAKSMANENKQSSLRISRELLKLCDSVMDIG